MLTTLQGQGNLLTGGGEAGLALAPINIEPKGQFMQDRMATLLKQYQQHGGVVNKAKRQFHFKLLMLKNSPAMFIYKPQLMMLQQNCRN